MQKINIIQHRALLVEKSKTDLDDYFTFTVSEPVMDLTGTPYGGARFSVEAKIDGKIFSKFTLDVGIGDVWLESDVINLKNYMPETLNPGSAKVISIEQHCAEKIHAYTLPRENFNSRVKDLVDLYLIFKFEKVNKENFKDTLTKTFKRRNTHPKPTVLPNPHELWKDRFERILKDFEAEKDIDSAFNLVNNFYQEIIT
ncbi:MAG: nucleotidyl transferase AbiEii/AbiGii toxin family protein [Bdellovibrionales bacterium]